MLSVFDPGIPRIDDFPQLSARMKLRLGKLPSGTWVESEQKLKVEFPS